MVFKKATILRKIKNLEETLARLKEIINDTSLETYLEDYRLQGHSCVVKVGGQP